MRFTQKKIKQGNIYIGKKAMKYYIVNWQSLLFMIHEEGGAPLDMRGGRPSHIKECLAKGYELNR